MNPIALDPRTARRHTAIVLISTVDRRILPALRFVARLPQTDAHALHVAVEPDETRQVAEAWMELDLTWLPLHIHDPSGGDLLDSVRKAVEQQADNRRDLTIVVPELTPARWWHPLLHRSTGRRIAQHLQQITGVITVIIPFATTPTR